MLFCLGGFVLWASHCEIDETVRARGRIEVQGRVSSRPVRRRGVLKELLVQEGDYVRRVRVLLSWIHGLLLRP